MAIFPRASLDNIPTLVTPEQKKQKKLLFIFVILILAITGVIYFGFFANKKSQLPAEQFSEEATDEFITHEVDVTALPGYSPSQEFAFVESVDIDFSLFKEKKFEDLKEFGSALDISVEKGRRNPFLPY